MVIVELDENTYSDLIGILQEKFYNTMDITELQKINRIYKCLKFESETWLDAKEPKN